MLILETGHLEWEMVMWYLAQIKLDDDYFVKFLIRNTM